MVGNSFKRRVFMILYSAETVNVVMNSEPRSTITNNSQLVTELGEWINNTLSYSIERENKEYDDAIYKYKTFPSPSLFYEQRK